MKEVHASTVINLQEGRPVQEQPDTRLHGRSLWVARAVWMLIFLVIIGMVVVNAPHLMRDTRYEWQVGEAMAAARTIFPTTTAFVRYIVALKVMAALVFAGTAVFLAWSQSDDWMVLFISATLLLLVFLFGFGQDVEKVRYPQLLEQMFPAIRMVVPTLIMGGLIGLFFLFPDGRFYPRWNRWVALVAFALSTTSFYALFDPSPGKFPELTEWLPEEWGWWLFVYSLLGALASGLTGRLQYYRRVANATQRQQIKLVLLGMSTIVIVLLLQLTILERLNFLSASWRHFVAVHTALFIPLVLPLTIGMSVLRYRLWNVDLFINRTLVFGGLTLLVTAVYVLVVGVLGVLFQEGGNVVLSIVATGLIAVLFHPLRQRLQRVVNRLMYGERDDPVTVLSRLGKRLEEAAVPGDTLPSLVETVAQTLKLPYVAITVEGDLVAAAGAIGQPTVHKYPLVYHSQPIGHLLVSARAGGEAFTASEERLLRNVARQAGPAVYVERLTNQLQRSRERLVATREEERRRLRRDLHDGLGPQLATLTVKVNAAQNLLRTDPDAAEQLLAEIKAESQSAVKEIRRVVQGLRPSSLDQLGLLSALREFAAQNRDGRMQITLHAPDLFPPLPAAVEVAAYRIATEAITNAVRHARAQNCTLHLEVNETLDLEVRDDGDGLPIDYELGVGLSSMRERAAELGGTFKVRSDPDQGTMIAVRLPLGRTE